MTSNKRTAINTANWSPELKRLLELLRGNPLEDDVWAFVESLFRLLGHGEGN
jgi:hypothetical protein